MSRRRTGTAIYVDPKPGEKQGHYRIRCTANDGSRPWFDFEPSPCSPQAEERARNSALMFTEGMLTEVTAKLRLSRQVPRGNLKKEGEAWIIRPCMPDGSRPRITLGTGLSRAMAAERASTWYEQREQMTALYMANCPAPLAATKKSSVGSWDLRVMSAIGDAITNMTDDPSAVLRAYRKLGDVISETFTKKSATRGLQYIDAATEALALTVCGWNADLNGRETSRCADAGIGSDGSRTNVLPTQSCAECSCEREVGRVTQREPEPQ